MPGYVTKYFRIYPLGKILMRRCTLVILKETKEKRIKEGKKERRTRKIKISFFNRYYTLECSLMDRYY